MTNNHIFTSSLTSTTKSINISDVENLSVSDTSETLKKRIITVNQFLYACPNPNSPPEHNIPVAQIDATDPADLTFVQYVYCSYSYYGTSGDKAMVDYPVKYDKWILLSGSKLRTSPLIPPGDNNLYAVLWAIDLTDPANPSVTSYEVNHVTTPSFALYSTYIGILGNILIYGYNEVIKAYDLTNLPTSIALQDTYSNGVLADVEDIVADAPNFYLTDTSAVHSFSYAASTITYLDTVTIPI